MLDFMAHACNSSPWQAEVELLQIWDRIGLQSEFQDGLSWAARPRFPHKSSGSSIYANNLSIWEVKTRELRAQGQSELI